MTNSTTFPLDWAVESLDRVSSKIQDGTHFSPKLGGSDFRYITSRNIGMGRLRLDSFEMISEAEHRKIYRRCDVRHGDLLLTKDGANTGNAAINTFCDEISLLSSVAFIRSNPRRSVAGYILQYLLSAPGRKQIADVMAGNAITRLTLAKIKALKVPLPPVVEQQRIAVTLRDADDLITALEQLIAKKQAIKQGLMQQLLTGKTRLPGFTQDWTPHRLRDHGSTYGGLTGKSKDDFGKGSASFVTFLDVIKNSRIDRPALERVVVGKAERQNQVMACDVLLNGSSETPDEVALAAVVEFEPDPHTYLNSFCFGYRLRTQNTIDPRFLAYLLRASVGRSLVASLAQGATRYNIAKTKFVELAPFFPPIDEQRAIASVLIDCESEIAGLRSRLSKVRDVKQGMMQELLTGRTRLPAHEVAS